MAGRAIGDVLSCFVFLAVAGTPSSSAGRARFTEAFARGLERS